MSNPQEVIVLRLLEEIKRGSNRQHLLLVHKINSGEIVQNLLQSYQARE
jgi:hypothetical protein